MTVLILATNLMSCAADTTSMISPTEPSLHQKPVANNTSLYDGNAADIWEKLQYQSSAKLKSTVQTATDPTEKGWAELALISKQNSTNIQALSQQLLAWQARYPTHPGNSLLPNDSTLNQLASMAPPAQIAVLLPEQGAFAPSSQAVRQGIMNAYYKNLPNTNKQGIKFYDTTQTNNLAELYQRAINDGAQFVIGPLLKENVQQLSRAGAIETQTLALNYTDVGFTSLPDNFYEFGLLPEDETGQMAERAKLAGLTRAIIISPDSAYGKRMVASFASRWQSGGGQIADTWYFNAKTDFGQSIAALMHVDTEQDKKLMREGSDRKTLENQRRQDFNVIFLFGSPANARLIVPLLRYYYASNIPIYASSSVYSGKANPTKDVDLNGVIVCDIPWKNSNANNKSRMNAVGQDAYLLSQTMQRLISMPNFPIYGTTGAMVLNSDHKIHRRLPCVAIRNGYL